MALFEKFIDGTVRDKVQIAIERLKAFEPEEGYWIAFSGGKDSVCILALAKMAGVKYDAHYSVTTVDPPEPKETNVEGQQSMFEEDKNEHDND